MQKEKEIGLLFSQKFITECCKMIFEEMLFKESKGQAIKSLQ